MTSDTKLAEMHRELVEALEIALFWAAQGDFSKLPMGTIEDMQLSRIKAQRLLRQARKFHPPAKGRKLTEPT